MRVTILSADSNLGRAIVVEASKRRLQLVAVVTDPARFVWAGDPVQTIRGDLLDLTLPERIFDETDVVVVPFGSWDKEGVDYASDIDTAMALCRVSARIARTPTRVVLVGRAPFDPVTDQCASHGGAHLLGELTTLGIYAAYAPFPWAYTTPYSSKSGMRGHEFFTMLQACPSGEFAQLNMADYLTAIVDTISGHQSEKFQSANGANVPDGVGANERVTASVLPSSN